MTGKSSTSTTNSATSVVSNVTIGEPYIGGPVETISYPASPTPSPVHWTDAWVKHFNPADLATRLEEELERRALLTATDMVQHPDKVVAALQRVLGIDATKIINLALEAKQDGK